MANKPTEKQITARAQSPALQTDKGDRIGVATGPTQALGDLFGGSVISRPHTTNYSAWANVSATLADIMQTYDRFHARQQQEKERERNKAEREAQRAQDKAEREAERAQDKAERAAEKEAERLEKLEREKRDSLLTVEGVNFGASFKTEALQKVEAGEWTPDDVVERAQKEIGSLNPEGSALWKAAKADVESAIKESHSLYMNRTLGAANTEIANGIQQGFHNALDAYDPDSPEDYVLKRTSLFQSKDGAGITGPAFNEMEMEALSNQVYKYALTDPNRALAFIELAEKERPDGSPSLAASANNGYTKTANLRKHVAEKVNATATTERKEADELRKESTKEAYTKALIEISELNTSEEVAQWVVANWDSKSVSERQAIYGDNVPNLIEKLSKRQTATTGTQKHPDNEKAFSEWSIAITRGTASWDDVEEDERLTEPQRARLFREMTKKQQDEKAGFLSTATLGGLLLDKVEAGWEGSIYQTPYKASARPSAGKPHVVVPEGAFYLNEYQKKINQLDPETDPQTSNKQRLDILEETVSDIHSGKIRYAQVASNPQEVPELKPAQKIMEGIPLTENEVNTAARMLNDGGVTAVKEGFGLDVIALVPQERDRIMAKAQAMKAELEAIKANTWFGRMSNAWSAGSDEGVIDAMEAEMQRSREISRLSLEGMELDRKIMTGESIKNE